MKKIFLIFTIALLAFSLIGCSQVDTNSSLVISSSVASSSSNIVPTSFMITDKNNFDYQPGLECSAFASAYLLRHYGEEAEGLKLYENFPNKVPDGGGVFPNGIAEFFNNHGGYTAEFKTDGTIDELKELVSHGNPIIVFIHVEEPYTSTHNTHYIPLIGYDEEYFYFAESLNDFANCKDEKDIPYNRKTEISKFERLWTNVDGFFENPYFLITKN